MTEAYKVSVELELEDKFTAKLKEIAKKLEDAGETLGKAGDGLKRYSEGGDSFVEMLRNTADSLTALGSNGGLKSAVSSFDRMAAASAQIARNMRALQHVGAPMGGVITHGSTYGGHGGLVGKPQFKTRKATSAVVAEGAEGAEVAEAAGVATAAEIAGSGVAAGAVVVEKALEVGAESFGKNVGLERQNGEIAKQLPISESERPAMMKHLKEKEFQDFKRFGFVTHGAIEPFAEARGEAYKAFSSQPSREKKEEMTDAVISGAAEGVGQAKIGLPEMTAQLSEFVEQANAKSGEQAASLIDSAIQASKSTGTQLDEVVENAQLAGKALESAAASGSENASHFMLLIASMQHGKMMDSESGKLFNTLSTNGLPDKLDGKTDSDKQRMAAGNELGLYNGDKAKFYQGDKIDLMSMVSIVAKARLESKQKPEEFKARIITLFGTKDDIGERLVSFVEAQSGPNLERLADMPKAAGAQNSGKASTGPEGISEKWDQIKANVTMALMNQTASFMKPVEGLLDYTLKASAGAVEFTQKHPDELMEMVLTRDVGIPLRDLITDWLSNRNKLPPPPMQTDRSHQGMHFVGRGPAGHWIKDGELPPEENQHSRFSHEPKFDTSKDQASNINVHFYIDGKEIATHMVASNSSGMSGFNTAATRPTPTTSAYGMGK